MSKTVDSFQQGTTSNLDETQDLGEAGIVVDSDLLFAAEFVRLGDDLLLRGPDGEELLLQDYFAQNPPPALETAEGARMSPETVDALAGPEFPTAYAQLGGAQLGQPIGEVSNLDGIARVQRADGSRADLEDGDPIFQGDVVSTGVGSELGILFIDDTVFALSANSRMLIDELIYNPGSTVNSMGISLIQGTFVFVTGQIAPSGGIEVETPVGTIGIRGTTVGVQVGTFGGATQIANLINPETGELGSFVFSNSAGDALFTLSNHFLDVRSANTDPGVPTVISGQDIVNAFGRALNRAIEIQRNLSQDQTEEPPNEPQDEQESELDAEQLQALEEAGLTPEQIEALLNEPVIETAAGPPQNPLQGQPLGEGSGFSGGLTPPGAGSGGGTGAGGGTDIETSSPPPSPSDGNVVPPTLGGGGGDDDDPPGNTVPTVSGPGTGTDEGGLVQIGPAALSASDAETSDPSLLVYTVTAASNGFVVLIVGDVPQVVFSFTEADVQNGLVFFAHDGSETTEGSFTVTVADPNGGVSAPTVVPIGVTPVDDAPFLLTNNLTVDEDGTAVLSSDNLSAGDVDTGPGDLVFTVSDVTGGEFQLVSVSPTPFAAAAVQQQAAVTSFTQQQINNGEVIFVHDGGEAPPSYSVSVSDGTNASPPQTVTVDFTPVNDDPEAVDDAVATDEDSILSGDVFADNGSGADSDAEGDDLTVTAVNGSAVNVGSQITLESGALLTLNADGTFDYDPNGQFGALGAEETAEDSFSYTVDDGNGGTDTATVTVTLNGMNDAPELLTNSLSVSEGGEVELSFENFSASDIDSDDAALVFTVSNVTGGRFVLRSNPEEIVTSFTQQQITEEEVLFFHDGGEAPPSYSVSVSDGDLSTDPVAAQIDFTPVNDPPVLGNNSLSLAEGETVTLSGANLSAADPDNDDAALTFTVSGVTGGRFSLASNLETTITTFTQQQIADGEVVFVHDGGEASPGYSVSVSDGDLSTDPVAAEIDFTPVNDPPVLGNNSLSLAEGGTATLSSENLSASDIDSDDAALVFAVSNVTGGRFVLRSNPEETVTSFTQQQITEEEVLFFHDGGEAPPSYDVSVSDGDLSTDPVAAEIDFTPVNDDPDARDDAFTVVGENGNLVLDLLADNGNGADSDAEGDSLTVIAINGNAFEPGSQIELGSGALLIIGEDGSFRYETNEQFPGLGAGESAEDSFTYTLSDGNGGSDTATVTLTIQGENDAPFAADNLYFIGENGELAANAIDDFDSIYGGDFDADDNDTLAVAAVNGVGASVGSPVTLASGALLLLNADGTFSYDPGTAFDSLEGGESGTDSFTYTLSDGNGGTDMAQVTIRINGVSDDPVAADDSFTTDEDNGFQGNLFADNGNGVDSDAESDSLTITLIDGQDAFFDDNLILASGAEILLNEDGSFTYNSQGVFNGLAVGQSAEDSFTYTIDDGNGGTDTATVTITIDGVNDAPVGGAGFLGAAANGTVEGDVLSPDAEIPVSDVDDGDLENLTVTQINGAAFVVGEAIGLPSGAQLTMGSGGTFVYDPNGQLGAEEEDSFEYTISDGNGGFATGSVSISIFPPVSGFTSSFSTVVQDVADVEEPVAEDVTLVTNSEDGRLTGTEGNDLLLGDSSLTGLALDGLDGDDVLRGGLGDDTLDGGAGSDSLFGGGGADLFVLRAADAAGTLEQADVIEDFEAGIDSLVLVDGLTADDLAVSETSEGDAVIALQSTGAFLAVVQGVSATDISPDDIDTMVS